MRGCFAVGALIDAWDARNGETMNDEPTKVCTGCGRSLPLDQFYRDRRKRDGQYSECKSCVKARRAADLAKRRAADKARRQRDPETARQRDRVYYQEHKEARNDAQRRYRQKRRQQQGQADGT